MQITKQEAIQAMKEGKKVRHCYFSSDEWMTMKDGMIVLEDGVICPSSEFWYWRMGHEWDKGYELINEDNG